MDPLNKDETLTIAGRQVTATDLARARQTVAAGSSSTGDFYAWEKLPFTEKEQAAIDAAGWLRALAGLLAAEGDTISIETTAVRLIDQAPNGFVFGVTIAGHREFVMPPSATAWTVATAVHDARARQIRDERAPTARPAVVGDVFGAHDPIPDNVTEVTTLDGRYRRAVGDDRYYRDEDGNVDREVEFDWIGISPFSGEVTGHSSTDGLYDYVPITVTAVAA